MEEHKLTFDDEDVRALYVIVDFALKYAGLAAQNAATRLIAKMPQQAEPTEEKEGKGKE